jgi:hypothetical protein
MQYMSGGTMNSVRRTAMLATVVLSVGCTQCATSTQNSGTGSSQRVTHAEVPLACTPQPGSEALTERASAYDSTTINVAGYTAQICYSRPSAKGRTIFGGLVPYGKLWRTGANEPTIIHIPFTAEIAGIRVEPGSYSIYTIPTETDWTIIVNRSISQWGHESQYKPEIQAQEVGRATVASQHLDDYVETFTIRQEPGAGGTSGSSDTVDLVLEWERTRVRVPIHFIAG